MCLDVQVVNDLLILQNQIKKRDTSTILDAWVVEVFRFLCARFEDGIGEKIILVSSGAELELVT
jgi:hypothetical protein